MLRIGELEGESGFPTPTGCNAREQPALEVPSMARAEEPDAGRPGRFARPAAALSSGS
jgi:hypothetical protein